jgi:hypothetical protein
MKTRSNFTVNGEQVVKNEISNCCPTVESIAVGTWFYLNVDCVNNKFLRYKHRKDSYIILNESPSNEYSCIDYADMEVTVVDVDIVYF